MKKPLNKKRFKRMDSAEISIIVILSLFALITLYPFYNVVILSISNIKATSSHSPYLLPWVMDLTGYETIMGDKFFFISLKNTLFVTFVGTTINMAMSVSMAYVLSKKELVGRKFLTTLVLIPMLFSAGMIPTYLVVKDYGLIDSIWAMIWPWAVSSYYVIIMKNYFTTLPPSLEEAAKIDGANDLQVLFRIILPISIPFISTFFLFYAVERWNEWWNAYLYISEKSLAPLQIYLREMLVNMNSQLALQAQLIVGTKVPMQALQSATIVITTIPIICIYPLIQKNFVKGVMVGSVKE